ncbi:metallophosphoesterase family protein [Sporolactobacillus putidus]|uniref:3',5'-cyclic-nucleotide phosphodiesterase n=1 Tax=Sporolactobacillus putidus TaxID=492735 RepID=A0A917S546_9BACL|nr:metallophosphoesterase [Sporolactobacillus putidus]GGL58855.1 3',5'-cyclic-nucleotide phosphodiesterase [Sporolactobacillus putidus]
MEKTTTFIHLSDIHMNPSSNKNIYGMGIDRSAKFMALFEDIKKQDLHPDFFIISGDLIHEGDEEDYRNLRRIINKKEQELGVPFFVCLGNHDNREAFWKGYKNEEDKNGEYYYTANVSGLRLIVLDSKNGEHEEGVVSSAQLDWLKNELEIPQPQGTLIVIHHPLFSAPLDFMAYSILQNTNELLDAMTGKDVLAILSGHIHFNATYETSGILNSVISSASYGIDCSNPRLHKFMDDSTYSIVRVSDRQVMVQQLSLPGNREVKYELPVDES